MSAQNKRRTIINRARLVGIGPFRHKRLTASIAPAFAQTSSLSAPELEFFPALEKEEDARASASFFSDSDHFKFTRQGRVFNFWHDHDGKVRYWTFNWLIKTILAVKRQMLPE